MNVDIATDESGRPQVTPRMFVDKCIAQGRVHPDERGYWLKALSDHPVEASEQLLKRRPMRALAQRHAGRSTPVSEDAYLTYARQTGVLGMRDDPRIGPSWAR
jgi:hypothetical protein